MSAVITVEGKILGRKRPVFTDWSVPLPPSVLSESPSLTLRDLIICVVKAEVLGFQQRQAEQKLQQFLGASAIAQGLQQGKVTMGDRDWEQTVDLDSAIDTAILGFIDGLYYVFLDDVQQEALDATVHLHPHSRLTFIRLVALAGG